MPQRRTSAQYVKTAIATVIETLRAISVDIDELERRRQHEVSDGYPASSLGDSAGGGTVSDPTARTAMQHVDGSTKRKVEDPTGNAIDTVFDCVEQIDELGKTARNAHRLVFETGESKRGRQLAIKVCHFGCPVSGAGEDRLWSGYCRPHYDRWRAWSAKEMEAGRDASPIAFRRMVEQEEQELTSSPKKNSRSVHSAAQRAISVR